MRDAELLEKLQTEPETGMQLLLGQYAGLVYAVVRGRLSSSVFCESDVEGCVADTFSEFYLDLDRYDPALGSIKAWLCVIAKNNALDHLRKYYREAEACALEEDLARYADGFSVEGDVEDKELRLELMKAIRDLGEPDREIIVRKFYLSQSSKEIGEKMNLTVSNIDTRTHRALKKLRQKFGGDCS